MRWLLVAMLLLSACIPPSSDPVSVGEICIGEPGCEDSVLLERDATGRSRIDFALTNTGDATVTITVLALVPESATVVDAGADAAAVIDVSDRIVAQRVVALSAGSEEIDRIAATELGTRRSLELALQCSDCSARLEYVFESEPLECSDDEDCSSGWVCDPALGRCAECLDDSFCSPEQSCSDNGRCLPAPETVGCQTAEGAPIWCILLVLVVLGFRRRRKLAAVAAALILLTAAPASAAPPGAGFSLGVGPRWIAGELGPVVQRGIGISLGQELRWDYVGMGVQLNWAAFLTTQEPPPLSNNLQLFDFTAGPRGFLPIGDFELVVGADYKRIGLASNSLVRLTGNDNGYHSVGGIVGARWDIGVDLRADVGVHQILGLNSQLVMFELSVALTAGR